MTSTPTISAASTQVEEIVTFELTAMPSQGAALAATALSRSAEVLTDRMVALPGTTVAVDGPDRILVTGPADRSTEIAARLQPGQLSFRPVVTTASPAVSATPDVLPAQPASADISQWQQTAAGALSEQSCVSLPPGARDDAERPLLACDRERAVVYLLDPAAVDGVNLSTAEAEVNPTTGAWVVAVTLDPAGQQIWFDYTSGSVGVQVALVIDGEVIVAPVINDAINSAVTEISANFTKEEAGELAESLRYGSLPVAFGVTQQG